MFLGSEIELGSLEMKLALGRRLCVKIWAGSMSDPTSLGALLYQFT